MQLYTKHACYAAESIKKSDNGRPDSEFDCYM